MLSKPLTNGSSSVVCETFSLFSPYHMQQVKQYHLRRELCQPSTSLRLDKRRWRTFNKPFRALHNALQGFILPMTHLALIEYKETLQIQCHIPHARYRFKKQALAAAGLSFVSSDIYFLCSFAEMTCWLCGVLCCSWCGSLSKWALARTASIITCSGTVAPF